jgi:hypothetical protein
MTSIAYLWKGNDSGLSPARSTGSWSRSGWIGHINNMQGVGGGTAVPGSHWVMASHQGGEGMLGAVGDLVA